MKVFVRSKVTDGEAYLIPFKDLFTSDGSLIINDLDGDKLTFDLYSYDFMVYFD